MRKTISLTLALILLFAAFVPYLLPFAKAAEPGAAGAFAPSEFSENPESVTTRGQFAALIIGMFEYACGSYSTYRVTPYNDTSTYKYNREIIAAVELDIVTPSAENPFYYPDQHITREQAAKMLYSLILAVEGKRDSELKPSDHLNLGNIFQWAYKPACMMLDLNVMELINGSFQAKEYFTKAEALEFAERLIGARGWAKAKPAAGRQIPVITYHNFSENPDEWSSITISPKLFEEHMTALKQAGYTAMLPRELLSALRRGTLPEKPILITIDDGYKSNYDYAFPALKKLNMKATIFVISRILDPNLNPDSRNPNSMTVEQAREMLESNLVSIQSHSYNLHITPETGSPIGVGKMPGESNEDYYDRLKTDYSYSRYITENVVGDKLIAYSYPFGIATETAESMLKANGVYFSCTTNYGVSVMSAAGGYSLKRVNAGSNMSGVDLMAKIQSYIY